MGQAYPELVRAEALITETLKLEETRFRKTLERGLALLDEATRDARQRGDMLAGETAFKLYDTYGFPLDLTQDALRAARHRRRSRRLRRGDGAPARRGARRPGRAPARPRPRAVWFALREKARRHRVPRLRDRDRRGRRSWRWSRTARTVDSAQAGRRRSRSSSTRRRSTANPAARSATPASIIGRRRRGSRHRHAEEGRRPVRPYRQGRAAARSRSATRVELDVDHARRTRDPRQPFGDPSAARGAAPGAGRPRRAEGLAGRARPAALRLLASQADDAPRRSQRVEDMANAVVLQNAPVDDAADGARRRRSPRARMALFGEKYGDEVRVVVDGRRRCTAPRRHRPIRSSSAAAPMSRRTGDIGLVTIVGDSAVAAGVRRIEALTGAAARKHAQRAASTALKRRRRR